MLNNKDKTQTSSHLTLAEDRPRYMSERVNLKSRKLPKLSSTDEEALKANIESFKTVLDEFPSYFYLNILDGAEHLTESILQTVRQSAEQDKPWLAFMSGYYGLIELLNYLKDYKSNETQEMILFIRDFLTTILSHQDEKFLEEAAAFVLKRKKDYSGNDLEMQETLSSLILNRIIDKKEIANVLLAYIKEELSLLENDLDPKADTYFKLMDIIGRYYSIALDIMFNFDAGSEAVERFYQNNYDKPYVSQTYFRNLFETFQFERLYEQLKHYKSRLKDRFDSFTIFFGYSEYYSILRLTLRIMFLLDEIQDYFYFLLKEFLSDRYLENDLEEIALLIREYLPEESYRDMLNSLLDDQDIPMKAKADLFYFLKEYRLLLDIALSDTEYFEKFFDRLYKIYPSEIQEKLIRDYYYDQPETARNRTHYRHLIEKLEDLRTDFGELNRIDDVVEYWRAHFSRKTAFMDELYKAGY